MEPSTTADGGRFQAPDPATLRPLFPQLEVLELLGRGGMGVVYKARQTLLDRLVALKILLPVQGENPAFAARFTREARTLAKLNHPGIVGIHDFGETGGLYFFLMEFVCGGNVRQLMQPGPLSAHEAVRLTIQICDALQYAHGEGVIHRDLKPENILLDKGGSAKIADFGLAKLLGLATSGPPLTASQQVMGTVHYMAPEQIERPLEVDHRVDLYSLGVVLYELLTGELPLGRFAPPSHKAPVDADLDPVVLRALDKNPDQRFADAGELKSALRSAPIGRLLHPRLADAIRVGQEPPAVRPATSPWPTRSTSVVDSVARGDVDQYRLQTPAGVKHRARYTIGTNFPPIPTRP